MKKSINELLQYINFEGSPKSWYNCILQIEGEYKNDWLDEINFYDILKFYSFDEKFKVRVYKELDVLKNDKILNYICYIFYYILYYADEQDYYDVWSWELNNNLFSEHGSFMLPVISLLCGYKFHIQNMKINNYDEEQIKIQKYNIRLVCTSDSIKYNLDGIRFSQMVWGSLFIKGKIIQIGRLQYEVGVGNFTKLDKYFNNIKEYVYIHIPKDKSLDENEVRESLKKSKECIKKYYPKIDINNLVFYTQTWLLSSEVKDILPEDSNIAKFQKLFNIIEYEENVNDFLNFVFDVGIEKVDYKDLPENTSLQKELKKYLLTDKKLHLGLGLLKENIEKLV